MSPRCRRSELPVNSSPRFRLQPFGSPRIGRNDGTPVGGRAIQRHRLALLAPGRQATRDKLIAHLWPDSDPERAGNRIEVSVYVVRQALGGETLVSAGDELRLEW